MRKPKASPHGLERLGAGIEARQDQGRFKVCSAFGCGLPFEPGGSPLTGIPIGS